MKSITRTFDNTITPTIDELATLFAEADDEEQALMFTKAAEQAEKWEGGMGPDHQWCSVGEHLAEPGNALGLKLLRTIVEFADEYLKEKP